MIGIPREELVSLLRDLRSEGSFSTRRTAPVDDLVIGVMGVGEVRFPVTVAQAKGLRLVARPARYGQGDQTILDRRVRDTWEVPRSRVRIDHVTARGRSHPRPPPRQANHPTMSTMA